MPNAAQLVGADFPLWVNPGQSFTARAFYKNTGTTTWTKDEVLPGIERYRLSSIDPVDNTVWGVFRGFLTAETPPGAVGEFVASLTAPNTMGRPRCFWQPVNELVERFGPPVGADIFVGDVASMTSGRQLPPPPANPEDLVSATIIDTLPYRCDALRRRITWTNTTGRTLRVPGDGVWLWTGCSSDVFADVHCELFRVSDGSTLAVNQWDRYGNPPLPFTRTPGLPESMYLAPGDGLEMLYVSVPFGGGGVNLSHHRATIWCQYVPEAP